MTYRLYLRRLAAALLLALSCSTASAAEPKPDITRASGNTEATVTFDSAVKADAPLLKYLTSAGTTWATKSLKELLAQRKDQRGLPAEIRNQQWAAERNYTQRALVADRYVSIIRLEYSYAGGAHPNHGSDTLLWDKQAGKMISIRPFFTELADDGAAMTAIRNAVVADLKIQKKKRDPDNTPDMSPVDALEPKLLKIGPVSLAPSTVSGKSSGLTFHYSPYAVGAYAEGDYTAFVPWDALRPYLSAEGTAIFGGQRPPDDDKGPQ